MDDFTEEQLMDLEHYLNGKLPSWKKSVLPGEPDGFCFLLKVGYKFYRIKEDMVTYYGNKMLFDNSPKFLGPGVKERASIGLALCCSLEGIPLIMNSEDKITRATISWRLDRGL